MSDSRQKSLTPSMPAFWLGVVIVWALIGSILAIFLKGPPGAPHYAFLGVSLSATIGYFYYMHRIGYMLGSGFSGKQVVYYLLLTGVGVALLVIIL